MKTNILSRALLAVGIVAFSAMITAGTCKIEIKGAGGGLVVTSAVKDKVTVEEKDGATVVSVPYGADTLVAKGTKSAAWDHTVAGAVTTLLTETTHNASKNIFSVAIKDAEQGVVFSAKQAADATVKSFTMSAPKNATEAANITVADAIKGFVYNPDAKKGLTFASAFLAKEGFTPMVKKDESQGKDQIGLVCTATATAITEAKVKEAKAKDKAEQALTDDSTFAGSHISLCYTVRDVSAVFTPWVDTAVDGAVRELKLSFLGVNTGKATLGDVVKAVPGLFEHKDGVASSGFTATTLEALGKAYKPTAALKVNVVLIKAAAAAK